MNNNGSNSEQVRNDNPFDLIVTDDGLIPTLNGTPVTMEEYRTFFAERVKKYKCKY